MTDCELREMVVAAIERFNKLSPEEQAAHRREQKISWAFGQLRLAGREVTREEVEAVLDLPLAALPNAPAAQRTLAVTLSQFTGSSTKDVRAHLTDSLHKLRDTTGREVTHEEVEEALLLPRVDDAYARARARPLSEQITYTRLFPNNVEVKTVYDPRLTKCRLCTADVRGSLEASCIQTTIVFNRPVELAKHDRDSVAVHRDERQTLIAEWAKRTFGEENWTPRIRALRFIEEAFELCQALGVDTESLTKVMNHVYAKPVGTPESELGGVGVALLAVADCANLHAEYQEAREARRVLEKSAEHFKARDQVKRDAGLV